LYGADYVKKPSTVLIWRTLHPAFLLLVPLIVSLGFIRTNAKAAAVNSQSVRHAQLLHRHALAKRSYKPGEVLVRFRASTPLSQRFQAHAAVNGSVVKTFSSVPSLDHVRLPAGVTVERAIAEYRKQPGVLYAEPNYIYQASQLTPNDPQFPLQWNLRNTGQSGGLAGADIHAAQAWSLTTGSSNVVVAVIDSGIDYTHPELASQTWSSPFSYTVTRTQGDVFTCPVGSHGFDAVNGDCDPQDDEGHGTHVSGILGAATNNGQGVAGVNWNVQILACKFLDANGNGDTAGALTCLDMIQSLKSIGVNIVATNNSWGGGAYSQALSDGILAQERSGILFIAAAGNDFSDNDLVPVYPASYFLPNVISVAASTRFDQFAGYSNVGERTTHLTAPGDQILSTTPNNTYSVLSGTSMATPHVTGVAALLSAYNSSYDWRQIKNLLLTGGDVVPGLSSTITGRRLNAAGSLTCSNQTLNKRVIPVTDVVSGTAGTPVTIAALSMNCASPAGPVQATVTPGGQIINLVDDGSGADQAAGDGLFTGQWTPPANGTYTISLPWGDAFQVDVLSNYSYSSAASTYVSVTGTNLNLTDDSVAQVSSPFPIQFGGGSFSQMYISSNGTISFTDPYADYMNSPMPPGQFPPFVIPQPNTLVAPWWQDLYPVQGNAQNVYWGVVGSAPNRTLVVEWRNVRTFLCNKDNNATVRFEAVFFENKSDIEFNYADTSFGGACTDQDYGAIATVGVQESQTSGQTYSYNGENLTDGMSVLWIIPGSAPSPNPVPTLLSISPPNIPRGGPGATLTITGSNFVPTSRVQYGGYDRSTTYVNATTLQVQLGAADLNFPFSTAVDVFNPAPGGGTSQSLSLTLVNPVPSITTLTPSTVTAGGLTFQLSVEGTGLQYGGFIYWNGQPLGFTQTLDPNTVQAQVPYSLIANAGTAQITVQTGSATSNSLPLTVLPNTTGGGIGMTAPATPQQLVTKASPIMADNYGGAQGPTGATLAQPMRFLGWKYGRTAGPAYQKYFTRPHAGLALPLPGSAASGATPALQTRSVLGLPQTMAAGSGAPGFGLRPTLPADYIPTAVATGDFNHDGHLDWAVANGGSNTIWVYLGNGDGTSQLPTILQLAGQAPLQIVAADLRHNGNLDLIVAEADTGTVGVLLGNGDGTFQPEVLYYAPVPILTLAVADFNGDGNIDIVAGLYGDATTGPLAFFAGDGKGHLAPVLIRPPEDYIGSFYTATIQVADLDGDGLPDLVTTDLGGVIYGAHAYINMGDGTFKHSDQVFVDGPFVTALNAAAADMDGDGCADIVISTDAGLTYLFHGNCNGTFIGFPSVFFVGAGDSGAGLALADVNGDGFLDVVTSSVSLDVGPYGPDAGDSVAVMLGDGKGHLSPGRIYRGQPGMFNIALGDLNGDGKLDVISANQETDSVSVYLNDGSGGFGDPLGTYVGPSVDGVTAGSINAPYSGPAIADVNGDGHPDIAFLEYPTWAWNPYAWELTVLLNDGSGHFSAPIRSSIFEGTFYITDLQFADVRGTGTADVVIVGYDLGYNSYLGYAQNLGKGTFGQLKITPSSDGSAFATGDFDGDGKLDMLLASTGQNGIGYSLTFLKGHGDGTFTPAGTTNFRVTSPAGGFPRNLFVADFNHDQKLDVIVTLNDNTIGPGAPTHPALELIGNGDGSFQQPTTIIPDTAYLTMADVNKDGNPDLVELVQPFTIQGFSAPTYTIHLGNSDGTFTTGSTYAPFSGLISGMAAAGPGAVAYPGPMVADFNGDGNLDILAPQRYPVYSNNGLNTLGRGYFQLLLGQGDGTFVPDYTVFDLAKIVPPNHAADVNGDGRADLIEVDPFPSSYNVIFATTGSSIQAALVTNPIAGSNGVLRLTLNPSRSSSSTITLTASDPHLNIPASVTVNAGTPVQDVPFTISRGYNTGRVFSLKAQLGSDTAIAYGTVALPGANVGYQLFLNNNSESTGLGGITQDYGLGIGSVNGYSSSVQLSCSGLPNGASCQFGQNPAAFGAGTFASVPLTVAVDGSTIAGTYPFTVQASDGNISQQISATLVITSVPSFSLAVSPINLVAFPGSIANYTLTYTQSSGLSLPVSCSVAPSGPTCSLNGMTIAPGQTNFSVSLGTAPAAFYDISISGTLSGNTQVASARLQLEDASISVTPATASITVGSSSNFNVNLTSLNNLVDQFTFSCPNLPAGVTCTFSPPSGVLQSTQPLNTVLTIHVNSRPPSSHVGRASTLKQSWLLKTSWLFVGIIFAGFCRGKKLRTTTWSLKTAMGATLLLLLGFVACGGGSSSTNPPPPPPQQTTVNIQVQASSPSVTKIFSSITVTVP
jgi:subtilisin family serine protease